MTGDVISVATLQRAMQQPDLVAEHQRLLAAINGAQQSGQVDTADQARRARWQAYKASLEPDSPSRRYRVLGGATTDAKQEQLREKYRDVDEPPDWFGR